MSSLFAKQGIIIAAPVYAATGKRAMAVLLTLLSGLSEPVAAAFALLLLRPMLTTARLALLLSATGMSSDVGVGHGHFSDHLG